MSELLESLNNLEIKKPPTLFQPQKQANHLGPFNKNDVLLPFGEHGLDLRFLGATEGSIEAARIYCDRLKDLSSKTGCIYASFIGQSGCGKTRAIFDVGMTHFVVFMEANDPTSLERIDSTTDKNFLRMAKEVQSVVNEYKEKRPERMHEWIKWRIYLEFLARFLYLYLLLEKFPELEPVEYLIGQINGGQPIINNICDILKKLDPPNTRELATELQNLLTEKKIDNDRRLIVAIDEANIASEMLFGVFKSPSGNPRGFLTAINTAIHMISVSTIWAGTTLNLLHADSIQSDIGKMNYLYKITCFKPSTSEEIGNWLHQVLDLSGCEEILKERQNELIGRKRIMTRVVEKLADPFLDKTNKSEAFSIAIENSLNSHLKRMKDRLKKAISTHKPQNPNFQSPLIPFLKKIVYSSILTHGNILLDSQEDFDLVNVGICQLVGSEDKFYWKLGENLAVKAILQVLLEIGEENPILEAQRLDIWNILMKNLPISSSKGVEFETLVICQMMEWNGKPLSELGIVTGNLSSITTLPNWMKNATFKIDLFGFASQLGFDNDLSVIDQMWNNKIKQRLALRCENVMRPEFLQIWHENDKKFALLIGCKLYSKTIPSELAEENQSSTDLSKVYLQKDGTSPHSASKQKREKFEQIIGWNDKKKQTLLDKFEGILRIHILLPKTTQNMTPTNRIQVHGKEISIFLDKTNIKTLFTDKKSLELLEFASRPAMEGPSEETSFCV